MKNIIFLIILILISAETKGQENSKTYPAIGFEVIHVVGNFNIHLRSNKFEGVIIETSQDLSKIKVFVKNSVLHLVNNNTVKDETIDVFIYYNNLRGMSLSGILNIDNKEDIIRSNIFKIKQHGICNINLSLKVDYLNVHMSGKGKSYFTGNATKYNIKITGSGQIESENLQSDNVRVHINGIGYAKFTAQTKIAAHISNGGRAYYRGLPDILDLSISKDSKISKID